MVEQELVEQARYIYHYTISFNKNTNNDILDNFAEKNQQFKTKRHKANTWNSLKIGTSGTWMFQELR